MNQKTILVVDDNPTNIDVVKSILQDNYKIKAAINGVRALAIATKTPAPDLILLDIMMPGMDGYQVCKELKSNPATRSIPVIFLSAKVTIEDQQHGMQIGAVAYLTKPIDPEVLLNTLSLISNFR